MFEKIIIPSGGNQISFNNENKLVVPSNPIIPYIQGDGIGLDITPAMKYVVDKSVEKAYKGEKKIHWMEIYAGEKAIEMYGENNYLPKETFEAMKQFVVSIKGPLTTPVGEGFRSLNVAIRQMMDLYACVRPIRYFPGTRTPLRSSSSTDMIIFRENTEDVYAGIEWPAESKEVKKILNFLIEEMNVVGIRFPNTSAIGIKPVSREGSSRLIKKAIEYAIANDRKSVSLVHKGNIMKFTEGGFRNWGYELALNEFNAKLIGNGPWCKIINPNNGNEIIIKDIIADNFLQQILLRPEEYDVIATLNLNGDYISDALAAQVGGIGIAPGANMSDTVAVFEATHGSAPKYAGKNRVNPGSIILSAEMMLRYLGWTEAADNIINGVARAIANKTVTYDLARVRVGIQTLLNKHESSQEIVKELEAIMPGAKLVTCSGFAEAIVEHM